MSESTETSAHPSATESAPPTLWLVALPLVALAMGHTISSLVRTMPAISADVVAGDLGVAAADVAVMTGVYHLAFAAGQIPVGVALDRFSVRSVATVLLLVIALGAIVSALVHSPPGFMAGQAILGAGCCGMLLCPMSYAAKATPAHQFPLWSAVILAVGNSGMVISASPMAWVVETFGWRIAWGLPALFAALAILAIQMTVKRVGSGTTPPPILAEVRAVGRIGFAPALRGVMILAFVSFAVMIGLRGMWGGPWLMDVRGMDRIAAGNVLLALTVMLIAMPMSVGLLERRVGHRHLLLVLGHVLAGAALVLLPLGAAAGLPIAFDVTMIVGFGVLISVQPLLFALGRGAVPTQDAGKALSAVNLAFFAGAAAIQAVSAPVASQFGYSGVLAFLGMLNIGGALIFWRLRARR